MFQQLRIKLHKLVSRKKTQEIYNPYRYPDGRVFDPDKIKKKSIVEPEAIEQPKKTPLSILTVLLSVISDDIKWVYSHSQHAKNKALKAKHNAEEYNRFVELAKGLK